MDLHKTKLMIVEKRGGLVAPPLYTQVDTKHGVAETVWINRKPSDAPVRIPQLVDANPNAALAADMTTPVFPVEYVEFEARDWMNRVWISERVEIEVQPDGTAALVDYGHNVVYRCRIWGTAADFAAMEAH